MKNKRFNLPNTLIAIFCLVYIITFPISVFEYVGGDRPELIVVPFFWLFVCFYVFVRLFKPKVEPVLDKTKFWRRDINLGVLKHLFKKINFFHNVKILFTTKVQIMILLVLLASGIFYWYEYRPQSIKKECFRYAEKSAIKMYSEESWTENINAKRDVSVQNAYYNLCLQKNGF